jgi:Type II secretory pathway, component PulD
MKKTSLAIMMGFIAPVLLTTSGCATKNMDNDEKEFDETNSNVTAGIKHGLAMSHSSTAVTVTDELYVTGGTIRLDEKDNLPDFFNKKVTFNQLDPVSFQEITSMIANDVHAKISLSSDAISFLEGDSGGSKSSGPQQAKGGDSTGGGNSGSSNSMEPLVSNDIDFAGLGVVGTQLTFSLEHTGTVSSLLDVVTSKASLSWKWDKNHIEIFRNETKHFVFDADNAVSEFNAQINSSQEATQGEGGGGSSKSMHGTAVSSKGVSIYDEVEATIKSMISPDGKYSVSRSMGDISITDTPKNLSNIEKYISEMNQSVNKRIAIRTEVYEITSDENGDFGIDWNAVNKGSSRFSMAMNTAFNSSTTPNLSLGIIDSDSNYNGTKAFINSLNKMAKTSLVTSASVFTTNGQPVPVQVADQKSYLERMSVETDATTGSKTYTMEPGTVMSGFSMSINPRVMSDGKVSMRFAVDMSQLNEIVDLKVGDTASGSEIQLPDVTAKNFIQRVAVGSGQTMMIAGFERKEVSSTTTSLAGKGSWFAGGSRSGGNRKIMTMILLTPYIMAK